MARMKMMGAVLAACAVVLLASPPADLLRALERPGDFRISHKVSDIPESVRTAFAKAAKLDKFEMAGPGARWQETDVIETPPLPWRRLRSVAISSSFVLVFCERGGFGESQNIAVFRLSGSSAEALWHAYVESPVADPTALRREIEERKTIDSPLY